MRRTTITIIISIAILVVPRLFIYWNNSGSFVADQALIREGISIYRSNYCGSCHTLSIASTRGMFAPDHDDIMSDANEYLNSDIYVGLAETPEEYIRESILDPDVFYTPGYEASNHHMPSFGHLSEQEIDTMVYMLSHQEFYDN